jgi:hypothetical protein
VRRRRAALLASTWLLSAASARAENQLSSESTDPTAPLLTLNLKYNLTNAHKVTFQPVIPFEAFGIQQLVRITLPYQITAPSGDVGLAATQLFDLFIFVHSWGRWGIGPDFNLLPGSGANGDHFQAGPAAGIALKVGDLKVGVLLQNFISRSASTSVLQPILSFAFSEWFNIGLGDLEFVWNWPQAEWTSVPLSIEPGFLIKIGSQTLKLSTKPQVQFRDVAGQQKWSITFTVALLVPEAS